MIDLETLGFLIDVAGELMIGVTALMVHRRILKDRKIGKRVFGLLHMEEFFGWLGVIMVLSGSIIQLSVR